MMKFLVPVDGSEGSERAVRFVISLYAHLAPIGVTLLHVEVRRAIAGAAACEAAPAASAVDAGMSPLRAAKRLLDRAGIEHVSALWPHDGYMPGVIVDYAREIGCAAIVMGTRGLGSTGDVLGSIARQVVAHAGVPVTLVK